MELAVAPEVASYFEKKEYFPRQKVVKKAGEDGLVLECFAGKYEEILPTILAWLPHITVQDPKELKDLVAGKIAAYNSKIK